MNGTVFFQFLDQMLLKRQTIGASFEILMIYILNNCNSTSNLSPFSLFSGKFLKYKIMYSQKIVRQILQILKV